MDFTNIQETDTMTNQIQNNNVWTTQNVAYKQESDQRGARLNHYVMRAVDILKHKDFYS